MNDTDRVLKAIKIGIRYGGIDGSHHKMWVIDQMIRVLAGDYYEKIVKDSCMDENGNEVYEWDCGIAP